MKTARLMLCGIAMAAVAQMKSPRPVLSFETVADVQGIKVSGASVRRVARNATEGRYAVEARFDAVEQAWIEIPILKGDWRGYGSVGLDAVNVSGEPVLFSMEVQDQAGARAVGRTGWVFAPREQASFVLSLVGPAVCSHYRIRPLRRHDFNHLQAWHR